MLRHRIWVAQAGLDKMSKKYQKLSQQQQQSKGVATVAASEQQEQQQNQLLAVNKGPDDGDEIGASLASRKRPKLVRQIGSDKLQNVDSSDVQDSGLSMSKLDDKNSGKDNDANGDNSNEATKLKCDKGETTILIKQEAQQDQKGEQQLQQQQRKSATDGGPMTHGKQNICAACSKPIRERYLLVALGKQWHEDCLKCACCDCRLGEVGSSLFTHSDKILCRRDFLRIFGQHGNCAACKRSIPPYELVMRANDNAYHMDCFACQRCQYRFCVGDRFHLTETHKIICLLCHTDQQQQQQQQQQHQLQGSTSFPAPAPASTGDIDYQRRRAGATGGEFVELSRLEPPPPTPISDIEPTLSRPVPTIVTSGSSVLVPRNAIPASSQQQASPSQVSSCHSHQQQQPTRTAAAGS